MCFSAVNRVLMHILCTYELIEVEYRLFVLIFMKRFLFICVIYLLSKLLLGIASRPFG